MKNKIKEVLENIRPEFDFANSDNFLEDGLLDSFDLITLVSSLDEVFEISIEGTEMTPENFQNIDTIEKLVQKYI
ncbi:acyl carrier protein [Aliarcobacter faecis]|uniref:phosphopantetheine-binding protein n=1 Tax=Aliarcobacter faecis TaxID=1564138 RepID=UPI00047A082D|nr:phosphopantetheine-binding protein [Aliarcobacter faecis]QKF73471.1 acyl carrier protein [Aliarcobacter faecis]